MHQLGIRPATRPKLLTPPIHRTQPKRETIKHTPDMLLFNTPVAGAPMDHPLQVPPGTILKIDTNDIPVIVAIATQRPKLAHEMLTVQLTQVLEDKALDRGAALAVAVDVDLLDDNLLDHARAAGVPPRGAISPEARDAKAAGAEHADAAPAVAQAVRPGCFAVEPGVARLAVPVNRAVVGVHVRWAGFGWFVQR
ncbi:hypothetical protein BP6252_05242 [Coleophoma cylindrospora]|uniref:Uncharacterized protein n=1 Tax=Coleophoma cylindrospora TaxID=1849047 RepID=A0A3D8RT25_9HELO|nr:hypothetical protein BP6252_05242 [Coleophoma cylindrospora]